MSEGEPRKLFELRVVDLRVELDKRGLEKSGVKAALMDRLGRALREEGKDPDTYLFLERPKRLSFSIKDEPEPETSGVTVVKIKQETVTENENIVPETVKSVVKQENGDNGVEIEDSLHLTIEDDDQLEEDVSPVPFEKQREEEAKKQDKTVEATTSMTTSTPTPSTSTAHTEPAEEVEQEVDEDKEATVKTDEKQQDCKKVEDVVVDEAVTDTAPSAVVEQTKNVKEEEECAAGGSGAGDVAVLQTDDNDLKKVAVTNDENGTSAAGGSEQPAATDSKETDSSVAATPSTSVTPKKNDKDAGRSLWISGLASKTRATDLKQLLSKYGKVVGAKIVANARSPSARCYGYAVMATVADAENCIKYCHRNELHGRCILIDKARSDRIDHDRRRDSPTRRAAAEDRSRNSRSVRSTSKDKPGEAKKEDEKDSKSEKRSDDGAGRSRGRSPRSTSRKKDYEKSERNRSRSARRDGKSVGKDEKTRRDDHYLKTDRSRERRRSRGGSPKSQTRRSDRGSPGHHRSRRSPSFDRRRGRKSPDTRRREVLSVRQLRDERERMRFRQRERDIREAEERRRRDEQHLVRELERRNKKEATRLERERERLRIERERLQREKADLIRLERKRIEQERIELSLKMVETRRPNKRPNEDRREGYPDDRKRIMMASTSSAHRYEGTDPMHFEIPSRSDSLAKKHEMYKNDEYKSRDMHNKRNDMRMNREEMREDIRARPDMRSSRDDYQKRDRADFAPPPPRLSGSGSINVITKYGTDSPPSYGGQGRSTHDLMRRETISSSVIASVRGGSGISKDMRYPDRVGPPGQSPEPSQSSYRGMHDERRDHNDHRPVGGHPLVHRGYDMGGIKDYGDRDHSGGWHPGGNQLKPFPSPVGMGVNSNNDPTRDGKKFETWIKGENAPMIWSSTGRGMDSGPTTGRYDRSNMERR